MFDAETTALLRAVLDELRENVSKYDSSARTGVASKILELATREGTSIEDLKRAGNSALLEAPATWR